MVPTEQKSFSLKCRPAVPFTEILNPAKVYRYSTKTAEEMERKGLGSSRLMSWAVSRPPNFNPPPPPHIYLHLLWK